MTQTAEKTGVRSTARKPPRADHVGSLLRPERLVRAVREIYEPGHTSLFEKERLRDRTALHALEDELIADVVRKQADAGLDLVTDGEFRRYAFINSFYDAVKGLRPGSGGVTWRGEGGEEVLNQDMVSIVSGRLEKIDSPAEREARFLASITDRPFKITFPAGSWFCLPFVYEHGITDRVYADHDELIDHAVSIERELIVEAIDAGASHVQLDFPTYPFFIDERWRNGFAEMGVDVDALLETCLRADRMVVEGLPSDVTYALHICRGNWQSRWLAEGSLEPIAERIFALPYDYFSMEWEDTTREGDYSPLRHVPEGPIVAMGIMSSKRPRIETEDELIRHMEEASRFLDIDQLAISPQCGFATSVPGNKIDEDTQWRKLEVLGRVADRLWPR